MTAMVNEVLILGEMDIQERRSPPEWIELSPFLLELAEDSGDRSRVRVSTEPPEARVETNRKQLRHAVLNLISNALKYSSSEKPIQVEASVNSEGLKISVRDDGIGIPPEDRPFLFQPFQRGSNVGSRPGSGLGLAIVARAAGAIGGSIRYSSPREGGSVFLLELPHG